MRLGPKEGSTRSRQEIVIELRAITYLAPGIPHRFFELITSYLGRSLGWKTSLLCETASSGPMQGDYDPFAAGEADIGFVCSPSFLYLSAAPNPTVALVPAGFVMNDPRHGGNEPVYYSDVVVRAADSAHSFADLKDRIWGYNDECSLSGYFSALQELHRIGCRSDFFSQLVRTGSHAASIDAILEGRIDAAAIDSTTLMLLRRHRPEVATTIRVVASLGPFPVQPIVARAELGTLFIERIAEVLLRLQCTETVGEELCDFGLERFVAVDKQFYAEERRQLRLLGHQLPGCV